LDGQFAESSQDIPDLGHATFSDLNEGDTVVGVAVVLAQRADIRFHFFGDRQASRVVSGLGDPGSGSHFLQACLLLGVGHAQISLSRQ